jgi:hypothetical protein
VNAPRAWPRSSLCRRLSATEGAALSTNGCARRGDRLWMWRARAVFPVPRALRRRSGHGARAARTMAGRMFSQYGRNIAVHPGVTCGGAGAAAVTLANRKLLTRQAGAAACVTFASARYSPAVNGVSNEGDRGGAATGQRAVRQSVRLPRQIYGNA